MRSRSHGRIVEGQVPPVRTARASASAWPLKLALLVCLPRLHSRRPVALSCRRRLTRHPARSRLPPQHVGCHAETNRRHWALAVGHRESYPRLRYHARVVVRPPDGSTHPTTPAWQPDPLPRPPQAAVMGPSNPQETSRESQVARASETSWESSTQRCQWTGELLGPPCGWVRSPVPAGTTPVALLA